MLGGIGPGQRGPPLSFFYVALSCIILDRLIFWIWCPSVPILRAGWLIDMFFGEEGTITRRTYEPAAVLPRRPWHPKPQTGRPIIRSKLEYTFPRGGDAKADSANNFSQKVRRKTESGGRSASTPQSYNTDDPQHAVSETSQSCRADPSTKHRPHYSS